MTSKLFNAKTVGKKRALVGCGGVMKGGAFIAGWLGRLGEEMGDSFPDFFNGGMYLGSVSVYEGTFALANQPRTILRTWNNYVDGLKLVNIFNYFIGRQTVKLDYLTRIFKSDIAQLNTEAVLKAKVRPTYLVTDFDTNQTLYLQPKTSQEIFDFLEAAATMPGLSRKKIINGNNYGDGVFSVGFGIAKAIEDGNEEILILSGDPDLELSEKLIVRIMRKIHSIRLYLTGQHVQFRLFKNYGVQLKKCFKLARSHPEKVEIVAPNINRALTPLNSGRKTIRQNVQSGWDYGGIWLYEHGYINADKVKRRMPRDVM